MANKECTKCIHKAVCKTAESCDGFVSGCTHFANGVVISNLETTTREKLMHLISDVVELYKSEYEELADHLIANGVTVQDSKGVEIDQFNKWISVKDRLPNCKKVIDGETYFKNVAVRVKDCKFEKIAFYDDEEEYWFDTNFFPAVGEVTHWCELPEWDLPQPPKGE